KSMGETPASHAGERERDLEWIWSVKHRAFPQGSGRMNSSIFLREQAKYFTKSSYETANISLAPELRRELGRFFLRGSLRPHHFDFHSCGQASSGVYHSYAHSIIPCTPVAVVANETSCQGHRTKREHVEQRIRPERKCGASGR
ncbi:hypothetical protein JOQ06_026010, partial [Pogonophryne albipinna]